MYSAALIRRTAQPVASVVETPGQVVEASCAFKDVDALSRLWVLVPEGRNIALRVHLVGPLRVRVDDGDAVRKQQFFG